MSYSRMLSFLALAVTIKGTAGKALSWASVGANGAISNSDSASEQKNGVVRRVKRANRVSTFDGLDRTDSWSLSQRGVDCSVTQHANATDLIDLEDAVTMGKTLLQCKSLCAVDDDCTCITHTLGTGKCVKQRLCYIEQCSPSITADTYLLHSSFKITSVKADGTIPQTSFERSGGRTCDGVDNVSTVTYGTNQLSSFTQVSVTECLHLCLNATGCSCTRYERYYNSICTLMSGCPLPTFCPRSEAYDIYVQTSPASAYRPTVTLRIHTCNIIGAKTADKVEIRLHSNGYWQDLDQPGTLKKGQWDNFTIDGPASNFDMRINDSDGWCVDNIQLDGKQVTTSRQWLDNPCAQDYYGHPCGAFVTWSLPETAAPTSAPTLMPCDCIPCGTYEAVNYTGGTCQYAKSGCSRLMGYGNGGCYTDAPPPSLCDCASKTVQSEACDCIACSQTSHSFNSGVCGVATDGCNAGAGSPAGCYTTASTACNCASRAASLV
jgi:hypothetical protein